MINLLQNFCDRKFRIENGNYLSNHYDIKARSGAGSALRPFVYKRFK